MTSSRCQVAKERSPAGAQATAAATAAIVSILFTYSSSSSSSSTLSFSRLRIGNQTIASTALGWAGLPSNSNSSSSVDQLRAI